MHVSDQSGKERRKWPRVNAALWVEELHGDDIFFRRTRDIGMGGAYFEQAVGHPAGTPLVLRIGVPGQHQPIDVHAEVVSSGANAEGLGMRVKFISVAQEQETRLREFFAL